MFKRLATTLLMALAVFGTFAAAQPRDGGTVTFAFPTEPDSWSPLKVTAAQSVQFLHLLYDTMVVMDYDVATIKPLVAESWDISDDGTEYTFHLRNDVYFHSGRQATANDWVFSFNELLKEDSVSPHGWRLGPVESIEATDEFTLVITLTEPYSELLTQLTLPFLSLLDQEVVEEYGEDYGIVFGGGSGPFMWERWNPGEQLVLTRNPNYTWGPDIHENRGPAHVETVIRRPIPEQTTMLFDLELGNIDVLINAPQNEVDRLRMIPELSIVPVSPLPSIDFISLKASRPLLQDVNVRRAITYAIDRQELADTVWFGLAAPAKGIILPTTPGFAENADWAVDNPEAAVALLEESGWELGNDGIRVKDGQRLEITFLLIASPINEQLALAMRQHLFDVGIDLKVNLMDGGLFWGESRTDSFDILRLDYGFNSALDILDNYFNSSNMPSPNRHGFPSARIDELLAAASVEVNEDAKNELLVQVQEIVATEGIFLPLVNVQQVYAVYEGVHNVKPHGQYLLGFGKLLDLWTER